MPTVPLVLELFGRDWIREFDPGEEILRLVKDLYLRLFDDGGLGEHSIEEVSRQLASDRKALGADRYELGRLFGLLADIVSQRHSEHQQGPSSEDRKPEKEPAHAPDFSWIAAGGELYQFTSDNQRECVRVLWQERERSGGLDGTGLHEQTIARRIGSSAYPCVGMTPWGRWGRAMGEFHIDSAVLRDLQERKARLELDLGFG